MTNDPAERELNKSQKFIRILEAVARRGGVSTSELMSRFDLDARTLRRYLADLRDCGLPLQDRVVEGNRVLSVDASWARSAVQLSLAEVLSLHFGRTLFTFLDGTSFAADMTDAIERLAPVIGREDAERTRVQLVHRLGNPLGARHARPRIRSWGEGEGESEQW
jgi:hypothetical protein